MNWAVINKEPSSIPFNNIMSHMWPESEEKEI